MRISDWSSDVCSSDLARANLLPAVNAEIGAAYDETRATRNMSSRSRDGSRGTWGLVLTQPLYDWSRWQRYEQSKLGVADAELQLQQAYQDLLDRKSTRLNSSH